MAKKGRPTAYREEYVDQVYKLCLLGLKDSEISNILGVSEVTLNAWKKKHPEFLKSITRGKEIADAEVAASLRERALGYSHDDVHISSYEGQITVTPVTKHYPPDTQAAAIWLYNRQPKYWKRQPAEDEADVVPTPVKIDVQVIDARKDADT